MRNYQGTWDDLTTELIGRRLYSNAGKVDYDYDNNRLKFQSGGSITNANDRVVWNYQKLHKVAKDSSLKMHVHFQMPNGGPFEFTLRYRLQQNGRAAATSWTTLTANTTNDARFSPTPDDFPEWNSVFNQIVVFPAIDLSTLGLSDIIQMQLARTDNTPDDIYVIYVDGHVKMDCFGSREEWAR